MASSLQNRRVWLGGGAVLALLIALAAWFLAISPELSSASSLHDRTANAATLNNTIMAKNAKLAQQYTQIGSLKAELTNALAALPSDSGLPAFTRQLAHSADASSVSMTGISVGGITSSAAAAPAAAASPSSSTATAPSSSSTTPATTPPAPGTTATTAAAAAGQYTITVTVTTSGSLTGQIAFINAVRNGSRRVLISSTQMTIAAGSRVASVDAGTTMTTQLTIFSSPMSPDQVAQLQKISTGR